MKKIVLTVLFTTALAFVFNSLIFSFYFNIHRRTKVDVFNSKADVVFLGSSRCVNTVIPEIFTKETGLKSINIGWASSNTREIYAALKIYLSRNAKPKYLFVQVDKQGSDTGISLLASQPLLKFYNRGIVEDYFTRDLSSKLSIPLYAFIHFRDFGWREMLKTCFRNENSSFQNLGYAPIYGSLLGSESLPKPFSYSAENCIGNKWLKKIKALCDENQMELVYFTAPYLSCKNLSQNQIQYLDGTKYLNFSDNINREDKFYDTEHLNDLGANEFSHRLGKMSLFFLKRNL